MIKDWLTAAVGIGGIAFGGVVAIVVKDWLDRKVKRLAADATVQVAEIQDRRDIRAELWKEIESLRADLDNMDVRLLKEIDKNAECERRALARDAKAEVQAERISHLEMQNIELTKMLLAAHLVMPVAVTPVVLPANGATNGGGSDTIG